MFLRCSTTDLEQITSMDNPTRREQRLEIYHEQMQELPHWQAAMPKEKRSLQTKKCVQAEFRCGRVQNKFKSGAKQLNEFECK